MNHHHHHDNYLNTEPLTKILVPRPLASFKNKMAVTIDGWYAGLLGLADGFLTSKPPRIKESIQCLQAVFQFHPSSAIQARTHLQIGRLLHSYTKNRDLARSHLEKAVSCVVFESF